MAKCTICQEQKDELYTCKECGQKFCASCGNITTQYCDDCKEYEKSDEIVEEEKEIVDDIQDMEQEEIEREGD